MQAFIAANNETMNTTLIEEVLNAMIAIQNELSGSCSSRVKRSSSKYNFFFFFFEKIRPGYFFTDMSNFLFCSGAGSAKLPPKLLWDGAKSTPFFLGEPLFY